MDTIRVKAAGVPIGSSYADLYEAMKFNRDMKYTLLYYGKNHLHRIKAQSMQDQLEQEIYTQPIIADMIQQEKEPDDENMLDIFEKMSRSMESAQFNRLLEGLAQFIREYCEYMFDKDEVKVIYACRNIRNAIATFSKLYQRSKQEKLTYREEHLLSVFLELYEEDDMADSNAGLSKALYDTDDPDAEAAVAKDEPDEKIFTDDYDDLA